MTKSTVVPTTHPVADRDGDVWEYIDGRWIYVSPGGYPMTWPMLHHDDCLGPYTPIVRPNDFHWAMLH